MPFLISAILIIAITMGLIGAGLGTVVNLARLNRIKFYIFYLALALSLLPIFEHAQYTEEYILRSGYGLSVEGTTKLKNSVSWFSSMTLIVISIAFIVSVFVSIIKPLLATPLPVVSAYVYLKLLIPAMHHRSGVGFLALDNIPNVWLFIYSVSLSCLLLAYSMISLRKPDL